jgi:murein DD-endopeptidase MepM/ murein hydrolase activator NlpD
MIRKQCVSVVLCIATAMVFFGCGKGGAASQNSGQGGLESPSALVYAESIISDESDAAPQPLSYTVYRVRSGDMIGPLAEQFGITQDTLFSVNKIKAARTLQIGQYLKVPPLSGILYDVRKDGETINDIAKIYEVSAEKIVEVNHISQTQILQAGTTLFVPDAELDWQTRQEINGDLFRWPLKIKWSFTSGFGWRRSPFTGARTYHGGIDLAVPAGSNTYAALAGTVVKVGYDDTYGNHVIIAHHSGYQTLYGHFSSVDVNQGDYVSTATVIGKVGSTGLSTGPHLHFTVYKNGRLVNPLGLLP